MDEAAVRERSALEQLAVTGECDTTLAFRDGDDFGVVVAVVIEGVETGEAQQMGEAEVKAAIEKAIAETGAAGVKDMGKVIGALRAAYAGQMDFGKASGWVKELLQ